MKVSKALKVTDLEVTVIEPIVLRALEEVRKTVLPLEGSVYMGRQTDPVLNRLGVPVADRGIALAVESPVLVTLEEVSLAVAAPDEGRVNVIGNAREAHGDFFRITGAHLLVIEAPIFASLFAEARRKKKKIEQKEDFIAKCQLNFCGSSLSLTAAALLLLKKRRGIFFHESYLEEESLAVGPRQRRVQIARQVVPVSSDSARIAVGKAIRFDLVIVQPFENIGRAVADASHRVYLAVLTKIWSVTIAGITLGRPWCRLWWIVTRLGGLGRQSWRRSVGALAIEGLDSKHVVFVQAEVRLVTLVERCHKRVTHTAVTQSKRMA